MYSDKQINILEQNNMQHNKIYHPEQIKYAITNLIKQANKYNIERETILDLTCAVKPIKLPPTQLFT